MVQTFQQSNTMSLQAAIPAQARRTTCHAPPCPSRPPPRQQVAAVPHGTTDAAQRLSGRQAPAEHAGSTPIMHGYTANCNRLLRPKSRRGAPGANPPAPRQPCCTAAARSHIPHLRLVMQTNSLQQGRQLVGFVGGGAACLQRGPHPAQALARVEKTTG